MSGALMTLRRTTSRLSGRIPTHPWDTARALLKSKTESQDADTLIKLSESVLWGTDVCEEPVVGRGVRT